ncbi:hypothetical protein KNG_10680 [Burkholderia pseudomallei]|nr:hypothetical protein KNG_10680 [Burkholderia pseudomallei]
MVVTYRIRRITKDEITGVCPLNQTLEVADDEFRISQGARHPLKVISLDDHLVFGTPGYVKLPPFIDPVNAIEASTIQVDQAGSLLRRVTWSAVT